MKVAAPLIAAFVWALPMAGVAQEAAPDPAEACRAIVGAPDAGVPANAGQAEQRRDALMEAADLCTEAAGMADAPADILFHAGNVAQGRRDIATAYMLFARATELGLAAAETRLGDYHLFGLAPGGEDVATAIAHYQKAAAQGDPAGMTTLALMYRVGKGVPRDAARMVALLTEAAGAGYHFAQYRLAQTYMRGEGIPGGADSTLGIPDPARAAGLYTGAAEAGNVIAALELARIYADPPAGLEPNPGEQARLTILAWSAGLPAATAAMGVLYETGTGVTASPDEAARFYVEALETGEVPFETLRAGAPARWDRETAMAFQRLLQERGLYRGAIDGVVGGGTAAAARALAGE